VKHTVQTLMHFKFVLDFRYIDAIQNYGNAEVTGSKAASKALIFTSVKFSRGISSTIFPLIEAWSQVQAASLIQTGV